ncbi:T9SS type A sorting domain-containing protein [Flavobacterium sp. 102]|uniref:T9SS type A sorting domain-containing protein n=1 Tax=Flavobacterium sp. 102 TaxID=2135623 RepID=UPI000EAFBD4C|nr:T9SS type A sorting domain-containing protein [Flavobacterium sp. 102]RKS01352.1 putative secreted protein (Por secretion system target) [Flavobacterium sp. 102]
MKKYICSIIALMTISLCSAQLVSLNQAEYFWDTDPGEGNGIPLMATDGNLNNAFEKISINGLNAPSVGLHKFSVRVKDNLGVWGPVFTNIIIVESTTTPTPMTLTQAEYFWDMDPGEGNATPLLATDGNFESAFEKVAVSGLNAPSEGLHKFSIRVKDNQGVWGPTYTNIIKVEQATTPTPLSLVQVEYFWDTDPGEGNGTPLLATDGNLNNAYEQFVQTAIPIVNPIGLHIFNVRVKDNQGIWGPVFKNVIYIETTLSVDTLIADNYYFYPNPANDVIRFNKDIEKVEIYDLGGRYINTSVLNEVNVSGLKTGVYLLKITTPEGLTFDKKMIKKQ